MSGVLSRATIYVNYAQAVSQANELDEQAARLRNIASNDCEGVINRLSREWKGDSANLYLRKCQVLKEELLKSANQLEKTATAIRTAAKKIRDADLRAREIAELREKTAKIIAGNKGSSGNGSGGGGGGFR